MVDTFDCKNTYLKEGSKGDKVKLLQTHLKTLGYYTTYNSHYLMVDGSFGTYTKIAVKNFQKAVGVTQDGVFGPVTCPHLNTKILEKNGVKTTPAKTETTTTTTTTTTTAATTDTTKTTTAPTPDPNAINTEKNVYKANQSNLHIQGIHLIISAVTINTATHGGNWKTYEMTNGKNYTYLGNDTPLDYSVECYLYRPHYEQLKPELEKLTRQVCRVIGDDIEPSHYTVTLQVAPAKKTHMKLTFKLTEYI